MGLEHLQGRRTGRRRGSKSTPAWIRDARWAYRNLGKPDAEPPSALAGRLVALGREQPDKFFACLMSLQPPTNAAEPRNRETATSADDVPEMLRGSGTLQATNDVNPIESSLTARQPRRLKAVFVPEAILTLCLAGGAAPRITNFPLPMRVVGYKIDPVREGVVLIIYSELFPVLPDGQPIPEFSANWTNGSR
jgi:hypothetical protein